LRNPNSLPFQSSLSQTLKKVSPIISPSQSQELKKLLSNCQTKTSNILKL
jgi:hypothetical protein